MVRLAPFVLSALLSALATSVDAKSKGDQIRAYQWTSDNCNDMPKGGNVDIKRNECVNIDARSFKPTIDQKRKKWLDDINKGHLQCALVVYDRPNCPNATHEADSMMLLPKEIDECYTTPDTYSIGSVKFFCAPSIFNDTVTETHTSTSTATSWSIGADDQLTPVTLKTTRTSTTAMMKVISTSIALDARGTEVRTKTNLKHAWMKHPWSGSVICYECYTKKHNDFGWVKCFAKAHEAHQCGLHPLGPDGKSTTTITDLASSTTTVIDSIVAPGTKYETTTATVSGAQASLQPRSWHRKVSFKSPWQPDQRFCADAEWEKRGKPNTEIRLQKVHLIGGKHHCESNTDIDPPEPVVETASVTKVQTETTTETGYTALATVTKTIYTAIKVSTVTLSEDPAAATPTTTYWPSEVTLTSLAETSFVITTLMPQQSTTTKYYRADVADDRADVPIHRDL